jgi:hypothetical protein
VVRVDLRQLARKVNDLGLPRCLLVALTRRSYSWIGSELLETDFRSLPTVDAKQIALWEAAFTSEHYPELFRGGETHDPGLRLVGQLSRFSQDVGYITRIVASALPAEYRGDLLDEIPEMVRGAITKGFDQTADRRRQTRPSVSDRLVELFDASGCSLFHDQTSRAFISRPQENSGTLTVPVRSSAAELWLRHLYHRDAGKAATDQQIKTAVGTIEARALFDAPQEEVHLRYARRDDAIFIDLGRADGKVVRISAQGWSSTYECSVKFYRSSGFGELPEPTRGAGLVKLRELLGLEPETFTLLTAFLLNAMRPGRQYMCLLLEGEQGSGKSELCGLLKKIVDPNVAANFRLPDAERDIMIQAKDHHLIVYDNASGMRGNISDALCSLATGGGLGVRKLYTDDELHVLTASRPFIVNGISDIASRPDLLERAIMITLRPMPEGARKGSAKIAAEFEGMLPELLGEVCDGIATALSRETSVTPPTTVRMADCALWLVAAEPGLGFEEGTLLKAVTQSQSELMAERIANNTVTLSLREFLRTKGGSFEGLVGPLFESLIGRVSHRDRFFPATPQHLSRELVRLKPALKLVGIFVELGPKTREGRLIRLWVEGHETMVEGHETMVPEPPRPWF